MGRPAVRTVGLATTALALYLSLAFLPWIGSAVGPFAAIPIALLHLDHRERGYTRIILAAAVLAAIVAYLLGPSAAAFFLCSFFLIGILLGEGVARGVAPDRTIGLATLVPLAASGLLAFGIAASRGGVIPVLRDAIRRGFEELILLYRQAGVPGEQIQAMQEAEGQAVEAILMLSPGLMVVFFGLAVTANYLAVRRWTAARYPLPVASLDRWFLPDVFVWGVIAAGSLLLIPFGAARVVGGNLVVVYLLLYGFQGLAVGAHFLTRWRVARLVRWAGLALVLIQPFLWLGLAAAGLADVWADFRKVRRSPTPVSSAR